MANEKLFRGGEFLIVDALPEEIFTPEDVTKDQRLIAQSAEEFGTKELSTRWEEFEDLNPELVRSMLEKAGELLLGVDLPKVGEGSETLRGERFSQQFILCKDLEGRAVEGADADLADKSEALQLVDRRQYLHLCYHAAADNGDLGQVILACHLHLPLSFRERERLRLALPGHHLRRRHGCDEFGEPQRQPKRLGQPYGESH